MPGAPSSSARRGARTNRRGKPLPPLPVLPRRVLVAVDGSGPSLRAVGYAAALAAARGATVELLLAIDTAALHALGLPRAARGRFETLTHEVETAAREDAEAQLARCRRTCEQAGVSCSTRVEMKPALEAILDAESGVDLIVIGSRGRGGLETGSLGSLSQRVVTRGAEAGAGRALRRDLSSHGASGSSGPLRSPLRPPCGAPDRRLLAVVRRPHGRAAAGGGRRAGGRHRVRDAAALRCRAPHPRCAPGPRSRRRSPTQWSSSPPSRPGSRSSPPIASTCASSSRSAGVAASPPTTSTAG